MKLPIVFLQDSESDIFSYAGTPTSFDNTGYRSHELAAANNGGYRSNAAADGGSYQLTEPGYLPNGGYPPNGATGPASSASSYGPSGPAAAPLTSSGFVPSHGPGGGGGYSSSGFSAEDIGLGYEDVHGIEIAAEAAVEQQINNDPR